MAHFEPHALLGDKYGIIVTCKVLLMYGHVNIGTYIFLFLF